MNAPSTPSDAYKAIIDQLAFETRRGGAGQRVREKGIYSAAPAHAAFNAFIRSLSEEQKKLLSDMLIHERDGAIGDVLAVLSWWTSCRQVGFTFRGEPMPVDLSGMGLHGDYVGRADDWPWPESEKG
jgi:hypothetical protein